MNREARVYRRHSYGESSFTRRGQAYRLPYVVRSTADHCPLACLDRSSSLSHMVGKLSPDQNRAVFTRPSNDSYRNGRRRPKLLIQTDDGILARTSASALVHVRSTLYLGVSADGYVSSSLFPAQSFNLLICAFQSGQPVLATT